ncbi:hypothetical protein K439DRAFT_744539 [Ramaria rubella]|nr:hypothetical protein K439DRAFT_744539 [Ramaria rubella]
MQAVVCCTERWGPSPGISFHHNLAHMDGKSSSNARGPKISPPIDERGKEHAGKRRRGNQLSCAECRRLKLRCDRVFPCTRFVLANTEEYHVKITNMSERIRQLENELATMHTGVPHPLLREDLLLVKVPIELSNTKPEAPQQPELEQPLSPGIRPRDSENVPVLLNANGTLKLGADGRSRFYGQTAGAEYFLKDDDAFDEEPFESLHPLPLDLQHVSHGFPLESKYRNVALIQNVLDHLPSFPEAQELVDIYYSHSSWLYDPCPRPQFMESFTHVFDHIEDPNGISLHRLALVFAIMAHGALMDLRQPPYSPLSAKLHLLSRASLSMTSFIGEPSVASVQALFLLGLFWVIFNKKELANAGWLVQGLNCKLAQVLGLHRDLDYWDNEERIHQREAHRQLYWEMLTLESLGLGRPPTVELSEIHCKMPALMPRTMSAPGTRLHEWHVWKQSFTPLVIRVLQKSLSAKTPPYLEILELDRSIQAHKLPSDSTMLLNGMTPPPPRPEEAPGLIMQRYILIQAHSTSLVLLHRGFFARALDEETDPMQSKFAPSVLATYTNAWRIILALQNVYAQQPELTGRFGLYWSNAFSASISMCLLVTSATRSSYAASAMEGLEMVHELFTAAAPLCAPASKALPIVTRLHSKARAAYAPYRQGLLASALDFVSDNEDEELKTLGGKTNISHLKVPPRPPRVTQLSYEETSGRRTRSPSLPLAMPPTDHLENVHPLLLQYVAQSRSVSDTYSEWPTEYTNVPAAASRPSEPFPEAVCPVPRAATYNSTPSNLQHQYSQEHQHQHHHQHLQQHHEQHHESQHEQPQYHGQHYEQPHNYATYAAQPEYSNHPQYYTDPSLDSYQVQSEVDQRNQYAAWQTHMEQLGLPF